MQPRGPRTARRAAARSDEPGRRAVGFPRIALAALSAFRTPRANLDAENGARRASAPGIGGALIRCMTRRPAASTRLLLAVGALLAARAAVAQGTPAAAISPGEQIEWRIEYLGLTAGSANLLIGRAEGDIWPVIARAKTDGLAQVIDVREHLVSYWNASARLPGGMDLDTLERGERRRDRTRFDRASGKATVWRWRKGREKEKVVDVPPDVQDSASAVMWLRMQPLEPGDRYEIPVFTGSRTFTLVAAVSDPEVVKTDAGEVTAIRVEIHLGFTGKFETSRPGRIWFTNDARHVPARMSFDFAVGTLTATMTRYEPGDQAVAAR
jgi:hypothetical protein